MYYFSLNDRGNKFHISELTEDLDQCPVCHKFMDPKKEEIIECCFCGRKFHFECVETWFREFNSCPCCLNQFLIPKI